MTATRTWTLEEVRALGVRTDLETAASVWGIGRTRAYELARAGEFPSPVVRIGNTWVALVAPMLRALGFDDVPAPTDVLDRVERVIPLRDQALGRDDSEPDSSEQLEPGSTNIPRRKVPDHGRSPTPASSNVRHIGGS